MSVEYIARISCDKCGYSAEVPVDGEYGHDPPERWSASLGFEYCPPCTPKPFIGPIQEFIYFGPMTPAQDMNARVIECLYAPAVDENCPRGTSYLLSGLEYWMPKESK